MIARLKAAAVGFSEDQAGQMGAALAYYTLFSLTPLLILAIAVLSMLYNEAESKAQVLEHLSKVCGAESAEAVGTLLDNFQNSRAKAGVSLVGVASLLFGAMGIFTSLRASLWRVWRLGADGDGILTGLVKTYLVALIMVLVSCAFIVVLLIATAAQPFLIKPWEEKHIALPMLSKGINFAIVSFLLTLLFVFTFRFLSDGRLPYRRLWYGAFISAVLFSVGKFALSAYFHYVNLASAYGAAGSLVVFLAWVYYSSQILFFGAEVVRTGLSIENLRT